MTAIVAMPDLPLPAVTGRAAPSDTSAEDRATFGALVDDSVAALTDDDAGTRDADGSSTESRTGAPSGTPSGEDATDGAASGEDDTDGAASMDEVAASAAAAALAVIPAVLAPSVGPTAPTEGGDTAAFVVVDARNGAVATTGAVASTDATGAGQDGATATAPAFDRPTTAGPTVAGPVAGDAPEIAPAAPAAGDAADGARATELPAGDGLAAGNAPATPGPAADPGAPHVGLATDAAPVAPRSDVAAEPATTEPGQPDPVADAAPWAQVARAVRGVRHHADGSHTMTLRLDPPELGTVRIELRSHDGQLSIHAAADSLATRDTLARALPELRAALEASGLETGTIDVDAHAPQHEQSHGDGAARDDAGGSPRAGGRGGDTTVASEPIGTPADGAAASRLDVHL